MQLSTWVFSKLFQSIRSVRSRSCSFVEPELTTVAQPKYKMGQEACRILIDEINEKDMVKKEMNLRPYLVERKTVK